MKTNNVLIEMLKRHEGSKINSRGRHILYKCSADKWTCGYGRNAEENGFSEDEAELMLQNDIEQASKDAKSLFPDFDGFTTNRQNALIDMVFNLGINRFKLFKNTIRAIKRDDCTAAARLAKQSRWHNQFWIRAIEIENLLEKG